MPEGTIEVELKRAHNLKDVEFLGKSDPYAVISVGHNFGVKDRFSNVIQNGGSNPVWDQRFLVEIPDGPSQLDIALFDKERHGKDEAMGTVSIPLAELFAKGSIPLSKYPVQRPDGKHHGELEVGLHFYPKVHRGTLEVHLVEAHGLLESDAIGLSDPFCHIHCKEQKHTSKISKGSNPVWNEPFTFKIDSDVTEVIINVFDKDLFKSDSLGTARIPLQKVFLTNHVPPLRFKVLGDKGQPQGEITVGLKFVPDAYQ